MEISEIDMEGGEFVVAIVGRWVVCGYGDWEFKLDKSRMGRCINLKGINSLGELEEMLKNMFSMNMSNISAGCTYWADDMLTRSNGLSVEPSVITSDANLRTFRALCQGDKSINLCVTFRELCGFELRVVPPIHVPVINLASAIPPSPAGNLSKPNFRRPEMEIQELNPVSESILEVGLVSFPGNPSFELGDSSSGGQRFCGSIDDETLLAHIEAAEALLPIPGGNDSHSDSDDGFTLDTESEEEDYNFDKWSSFVRNDGVDGTSKSLSDDDFVDPPPTKKLSVGNVTNRRSVSSNRHPMKMSAIAEQIKKGLSIHDVYGYDDLEPMFDEIEFSPNKINEIDFSKEDDAMFVGREFMSRQDFKIALSIYAINRVFRFRFARFDKLYLVAECLDRRCDWRVYAHQIGDSDEYMVRKANLEHSCDVNTRSQFTKHATSRVVAALLRSKYVNANAGPRARDVSDIMLDENNVRISYWKGWKAKELAVESAQGTEESSYVLLPVYLFVLKLANPGTIYHLHTEKDVLGDERFKFVFLALGASIAGIKHLRRIVVVDGTHLHGKFKGCLLTASGQDANFQIFPIAFAVVDGENDESWVWFMTKLSEVCLDGPDLTIISDRQQSIYKAIGIVYPLAHHGACLVHIRRNVKAKYRKGKVSKLVWDAGCMFRLMDFDKIYERIKRRDIDCWNFLESIPLEHWTRSHFKGDRFNIMTSNIAESLNKALLPARGSPIVALLEFIRRMISRWLAARRVKISKLMPGDIPSAVEKQCLKRFKDSVGCSVMASGSWDYEVGEKNGARFHVNLERKMCSCLEFQKLAIPCRHAMAAAHDIGLDYKTLVGREYKVPTWLDTVSGIILPVKDPAEVEVPDNVRIMYIMKPIVKRPPGRPPKLRIPSMGEYEGKGKSQQPNKCGRCRGHGHNRVTCTAPLK